MDRAAAGVFDVIVVGSGAGGAAVAHELAKRGMATLVLEAGPDVGDGSLGRFFPSAVSPGYYDGMAIFSRSIEGSIIYHTSNLGGSTVFACGNMTRNRNAEETFSRDFGMTGLSLCFDEAEREASVEPMPLGLMSTGSKRLLAASTRLGLDAEPAAKGFVERKSCHGCGKCVFGCRYGAKWDSRFYLASLSDKGGSLRTAARVEEILFDGKRARGVVVKRGRKRERIEGGIVVLAAGALNTPRHREKAGIDAGNGLFLDYFSCVYGTARDADQARGRSMPIIVDRSHEAGFLLSPFIDDWLQYALFTPLALSLRRGFSRKHVLGMMVKIADQRSGTVAPDGTIRKKPTQADEVRMDAGVEVARSVLKEAGCRDLVRTVVWRGAHPGGTAAIGEVVDNELKVKAREGLYVCDASLFPFALGFPPILTITALGKWLGKRLVVADRR